MITSAAPAAFAVLALLEGAAPVPAMPPLAEPFDCSWIYHEPRGPRERFEGVYYSFIDDSGFYPCASAAACRDWMGKRADQISFSDRASEQMRRRSIDLYGVFRIAFEGRRAELGTRPGCERGALSLEERGEDYIKVERVLRARPLE